MRVTQKTKQPQNRKYKPQARHKSFRKIEKITFHRKQHQLFMFVWLVSSLYFRCTEIGHRHHCYILFHLFTFLFQLSIRNTCGSVISYTSHNLSNKWLYSKIWHDEIILFQIDSLQNHSNRNKYVVSETCNICQLFSVQCSLTHN